MQDILGMTKERLQLKKSAPVLILTGLFGSHGYRKGKDPFLQPRFIFLFF
uniref:Uncharacterized protein n=1 Tax=Anguilla anguilla TaxID=7936 RepID=A0A0E9PNM2_ANGAN